MAINSWPTKLLSVASLHLDIKNPRIGRETTARAPRDIIQYLFDNDKALEVAQSISARGYFPNEPLLAIKEKNQLVVVEGNRRLAALKALRDPGLLDGSVYRYVERLSRQIEDPQDIARVPVTIAPSRRATDKLLAGRHIGTPVLKWEKENRASFILDKLADGYTNEQLHDQLGFDIEDIQAARQTRAIADMARSLDLPDEVMGKLENPRLKMLTTLERIFTSSVGRQYLMVEPDPEHGIRGLTTKAEFLKGFKKIVTDIALKDESSRTLNKNDDIEKYFKERWSPDELPAKKQGTFVPGDIIQGRSVASFRLKPRTRETSKRIKSISDRVLPRDFRVLYGGDRLKDIRTELTKLKREEYPNAGAVLLRVFFEITVLDYLERTNELEGIIRKIEQKMNGRKLQFGIPKLKDMIPEIIRIAKKNLNSSDAAKVEKAVKYDSSAPFSISELHGFVHHPDFPAARDIFQFWKRTEPLLRLMVEHEPEVRLNEDI